MDVGYCTNVHSGATLDETLANLDRHSVAVRERLGWDELPIGLWLSASAAEEALGRVDEIRVFLKERRLRVFTMNAFPYGDFHAEVVKHAVYRPTWAEESRVEYTLNCAKLLAQMVPEGAHASISTLPIAWRADADDELIAKAGENLRRVAAELAEIETETGRHITVDLEPEPGCYLDKAEDVVEFFGDQLPDESHRKFVGICHDTCHSAVMFEGQSTVIWRYGAIGINVNKLQMSSALRADGSEESIGALRAFVEDRYLHQTCVRVGKEVRFFEDLPDALAAHDSGELPRGEWRVHFHVPVYLARVGALGTTRDQVYLGVRAAWTTHGLRDFEVETYAWDVLPASAGADDLASGVAEELRFVHEEVVERARVPGLLRDWFELARVSNLPTVWANVLVGLAAGHAAGAPWELLDLTRVFLFGFMMSCLYACGMILNDVFDVARDRFDRPDRAIASGRITRSHAALVAAGGMSFVVFALMSLRGGPGLLVLGLAGAIVLYNWLHKRVPASLVLMGVCRALVVLIAAAATPNGIGETAWWVASAVGAYTVLLTLAARDEESRQPTISRVGFAWMTLGVLQALWFGLGGGSAAAGVMGVVCAGWLARSALMISRGGRGVGAGIMGLLSGFCLVDAFALMLLGHPGLAAAAVGCFVLTVLGHRRVSGT